MYIKELILDGFKSYATRTVVKDFDPMFNAITGLNGSGKSNILDSICFVLGITQLSQIRTSSLNGLVYKNGQAGITKASVTILFDNTDKDQAPVGFESFDEITVTRIVVIGGKNKYMINGKTTQASNVQNMFHSVKLNVNNPHFLIMQGRITKVLNMKPREILGMIEEAAGTRMYETKKVQAQKRMQQKQVKVEEINKLLEKEITPKLQKLQKEKQDFLKYTTAQEELERVEKFCVAHEFYTKAQMVEKVNETIEQINSENLRLRSVLEESDADKAQLEKQLNKIKKSLRGGIEKRVAEASKNKDNCRKNLAKVSSKAENTRKKIERDQKALTKLQKKCETNASKLSDLENAVSEGRVASEKLKSEVEVAEREFQLCRENLRAANSGMQVHAGKETGKNKELTLTESLTSTKNEVKRLETMDRQHNLKLKHSKSELRKVESLLKKISDQSNSNAAMELDAAVTRRSKILNQISSTARKVIPELEDSIEASKILNHLESKHKELKGHLHASGRDLRNMNDKLEASEAKLVSLNFDYDSSAVKFSPTDFKGLVFDLINVKDAKWCAALESVAGSKLFQVVVTTELVGKDLLENGKLKKRTTILPLNKIQYRKLNEKKLDLAKEIARAENGVAMLASECITYEQDVSGAILYVFGSTIVCDSLSLARKIAFNDKIRARTVTIDGDSVDPSGVLSGGSRRSQRSVLGEKKKIVELREQLQNIQNERSKLNGDLDELERALSQVRDLLEVIQKLDLEIECLTNDVNDSELGEALNQKSQLENQIKETEEAKKSDAAQLDNHRNLLRELEEKVKDVEKATKGMIKDAEDKLKEAKSKLEAIKLKYHKCHQKFSSSEQNLKSYNEDKDALVQEIDELKNALETSQETLAVENQAANKAKSTLEDAEEFLKNVTSELEAANSDVSDLTKKINKIEKQHGETELSLKKAEGRLKCISTEQQDARKLLKNLSRKHPWIGSQKKYFNVPNGNFDFENSNISSLKEKWKKLKQVSSSLANKVSNKAMSLVEKVEKEYEELKKKQEIITKDRETIEQAIVELDEKKNQTLFDTYKKVNKDFGSIFSTLLRGSYAKLVPVDGKKKKQNKTKKKDHESDSEQSMESDIDLKDSGDLDPSQTVVDGQTITRSDILDGVEVKIAFSKSQWKESLSELSGGQRSLLALSLILSFLLFKPAPMYILDEVDAALDLSHTQNIGIMLRKHFKQSQFIVVSLKEGMFSNANVIFRTKFVDGVSTVRRTLGRLGNLSLDHDKENESEFSNDNMRKRKSNN